MSDTTSDTTLTTIRITSNLSNGEGCVVPESNVHSHAEGKETTATGEFSHSEGVSSVASDKYSFVWNGVETESVPSSGEGTFVLNPKGGAEGLFVGGKALKSYLDEKANVADAVLKGDNEKKDFALRSSITAYKETSANYFFDKTKFVLISEEELHECGGVCSVTLFGGATVSHTDSVNMVLWSHDTTQTDVFNDSTCKFLGYSDSAVAITANYPTTWFFTSDPFGIALPLGQDLILQGVPSDVEIKPDEWTWSAKGFGYSALSLYGNASTTNPKDSFVFDYDGSTQLAQCTAWFIAQTIPKNRVDFKNTDIDVTRGVGDADLSMVDRSYKVNSTGIGTIVKDYAVSEAVSKSEDSAKTLYVQKTTKVNGMALSADVTLTGEGIKIDSSDGSKTVEEENEARDKVLKTTFEYGDGGASGDCFSRTLYCLLAKGHVPGSAIRSVSVMAGPDVTEGGKKKLVLWSVDGTVTLDDTHCKFVAVSKESNEQTASGFSKWTFDDVKVQQNSSLIVQGVPESENPDETWTWSSKGRVFNVLSVKCKSNSDGCKIVTTTGTFNYELRCEVECLLQPLVDGINTSTSQLVGQTDYFAPVSMSNGNKLKIDLAGISPYVNSESGKYGVVAVTTGGTGFKKENLGQTAISDTKEIVVLKPNQVTKNTPGVVSPTLASAPSTASLAASGFITGETALSGDTKASMKPYVNATTFTKAVTSEEDLKKLTDSQKAQFKADDSTAVSLGMTEYYLTKVVPDTRTVNSKALSGNITLTASDFGVFLSKNNITVGSSSMTALTAETDPVFTEWRDSYDISLGNGATITGDAVNWCSTALGSGSKAASGGIAIGNGSEATSPGSMAFGNNANATHVYSVVFGIGATDAYSQGQFTFNLPYGPDDFYFNSCWEPGDDNSEARTLQSYLDERATTEALTAGVKDAKDYADTVAERVLKYKGSVEKYSELEGKKETAKVGDTWNVEETGANYAWTGEEWDKLSETLDLTVYALKTTTVNKKPLSDNVTLSASDVGVTLDQTTGKITVDGKSITPVLSVPTATSTTLGVVKLGTDSKNTSDDVAKVAFNNSEQMVVGAASSTSFGVVKVVDNGTYISLSVG